MTDITQNYQIKYSEKWGSYLQQEASRLEKYVTVESGLSGKMVAFDQYGLLSFNEKTERMQATTLDEAPTTRRVVYPKIFTKAVGFDEFDAKKLANIDIPVSKTIEGLRAAAGRCMDSVMLEGFLGTCYVGENGTEAVSFDPNQVIAEDYVESGTAVSNNLTVGKLRKALSMLQKAEAWNEERRAYGDELVLACSSSQIAALLREPEVGSFDYNTARALVEGKVDTFLLNEVEGADMTGETEPDCILDCMLERWPHCHIVLTLGADGAMYADSTQRIHQEAFRVQAVDTTAAGDTFTGYFLHAMLEGKDPAFALREASLASSIAVSRPGAAASVPLLNEVRG